MGCRRSRTPVGGYDVIADFGQARGTNTASILPNDALFSRRYGRTILLRDNIMKNPDIFAADERIWRAVTVEAHAADLAPEGNSQRTLWHEIGHYPRFRKPVGPDARVISFVHKLLPYGPQTFLIRKLLGLPPPERRVLS
ncbi:hypothetical protein KYC5002_43180 [Archangium violaceum]|uniref:hypothetical protein n=1 Tax=Archangium violaceum TaxID=83451 RepID=UPI002B30395D|nr:hypothetical protein KYC5002_43180 [Archangium gephyra]